MRQKKRKEKRPPEPRSEALLVKPAEGKTFVQELSETGIKANPQATGMEVMTVRGTGSGDVMLDLESKTQNKVGFCETLREVLGTSAAVRSLEPRLTLEFRDLDCVTTEEKVVDAVTRDTGDFVG